MQQKLEAMKNDDAIMLVMAGKQNAYLGLRENGINPEGYDNQELMLNHWVGTIISSLSNGEHPADVVAEFASIGIKA